jgi:gluconate:H+ symporter, GntP family
MIGVVDVKQQIISWSVSITIIWAIAGVQIALINLLFGSGGSLLDPLIPIIGLGIIYLVLRRKK